MKKRKVSKEPKQKVDLLEDAITKLQDELLGIKKESVAGAFKCIVDEAVKNMKKGARGEGLAAMALTALVDASFSLPNEIVPKKTKFFIISFVASIFEQTRITILGWQGQHNKACGKLPGGGGLACIIPKDGSTCFQKKENGIWYCISN